MMLVPLCRDQTLRTTDKRHSPLQTPGRARLEVFAIKGACTIRVLDNSELIDGFSAVSVSHWWPRMTSGLSCPSFFPASGNSLAGVLALVLTILIGSCQFLSQGLERCQPVHLTHRVSFCLVLVFAGLWEDLTILRACPRSPVTGLHLPG